MKKCIEFSYQLVTTNLNLSSNFRDLKINTKRKVVYDMDDLFRSEKYIQDDQLNRTEVSGFICMDKTVSVLSSIWS